MASSAPSTEGLTPAQRLAAAHAADEAHQPTVEEVVDESDLPISTDQPSSVPTAPVSTSAEGVSSYAKPMSAKAAGKRPAADPSLAPRTSRIDTQSEEAFPSLGASKTSTISAPTSGWGKPPASVQQQAPAGTNGHVNGASRALNMPLRPAGSGQTMSLPGQYTEVMRMNANQIKSKQELRKPIPDILRDLMKRSKAKVDMQIVGNAVVFTGKGPSTESVQLLLKDIASTMGAEVCSNASSWESPTDTYFLDEHQSLCSFLRSPFYHREAGCQHQGNEPAHGRSHPAPQIRDHEAYNSG